MSAHTPTPWRKRNWPAGLVITSGIPGLDLLIVATVEAGESDPEPDADLIVRAVNAHEALVSACKLALAYMEERGVYDTAERAAPLRAALKLAGVETCGASDATSTEDEDPEHTEDAIARRDRGES